MNGAETLVQTLVESNVTLCFANPGTSEMHFLAALDANPDVHCVLCLFEAVASAAADGYARMTRRPAATLLHLGPGLANSGANLHNAMRAASPIVNIVGDHARYHRHLDAPLTSDIEALARTWSVWVRTARNAKTVACDAAEAIARARTGAGGTATLILPADTAWNDAEEAAPPLNIPARARSCPSRIEHIATIVRSGEPTLLLMGGEALASASALEAADRISQRCGVEVLGETSNARIERGAGRVAIDLVPYSVDDALIRLKDFRHCILLGSRAPVGFFAYPGKPGELLPPGCVVHTLAHPHEDGEAAVEALCAAVDASSLEPQLVSPNQDRLLPSGDLTSAAIGASLANRLPDGAIICDEALTLGGPIFRALRTAAPHTQLQLTGGAIGIGLPLAIGAAVACPQRKVIVLQADGSGMYTNQAFWTHAREELDIVSIILSNRTYAILRHELRNVGVSNPGPRALGMTSLDRPAIDWVGLAESMGVSAGLASTAEEFDALLARSMATKGPFAIEAEVAS